MKNLVVFFVTAVFFIENAGLGYEGNALRPLATGNSSAKLKAALVLIGSSSREKPSSEALKDILVSSRPVSKKRPRERFDTAAGKHSIKHSILLGLPESHFLLDAELRLENILGGILYKGLADPKRRDRIPIKKVPTGKMKTLAMIAEEEKGRTILVDEALLSLPYTLYISLAGQSGIIWRRDLPIKPIAILSFIRSWHICLWIRQPKRSFVTKPRNSKVKIRQTSMSS